MAKNNKRDVAPMIRNILAFDIQLTQVFVKYAENLMFARKLKSYYKALEISCHGVPWIASTIAFVWILNNKNLYQMQINLLLALILDIIVVAVLKASTRRRRPTVNDDPLSIGPDKYSFPSGHASRAMLVFYFYKYLWPVSGIYLAPLLAWVSAVVVSRLLMRRHYILDISVGLLIGYVEGMLMSLLYLDAQTCFNLVSLLTDEKLDGAEYDI